MLCETSTDAGMRIILYISTRYAYKRVKDVEVLKKMGPGCAVIFERNQKVEVFTDWDPIFLNRNLGCVS